MDKEQIISDVLASAIDDIAIKRQVFSSDSWNLEEVLSIAERIGKVYAQDFRIDDDNKKTFVNLIYWMFNDKRMQAGNPITKSLMPGRLNRGIYLYGKTGTGKTLATKILAKLASVYGVKYSKAGVIYPLSWLDVRADILVDEYSRGNSLSDFKRAPILCIQDLGSEELEAVYMGNRVNVLKNIIEQRGDKPELITHFTSNIPLDAKELTDRYGDRAVSRLKGMCNFLTLRGVDRRLIF